MDNRWPLTTITCFIALFRVFLEKIIHCIKYFINYHPVIGIVENLRTLNILWEVAGQLCVEHVDEQQRDNRDPQSKAKAVDLFASEKVAWKPATLFSEIHDFR
jgi:hypothetical protein